jgi:hypothetical protein
MRPTTTATAILGALAAVLACGGTATQPATGAAPAGDVPAAFQRFTTGIQVTREGDYVVVRSTGVPNHGSPYFATTDSRYEPYSGTNPGFRINPNRIVAQSYVFRIPVTPTRAATTQATPLGAIGVMLNGVPIYNQYAGPNQPLTNEIDSFDHYNGHPQQSGAYHYHVEPLFLTQSLGRSGLIGFLVDGYPVYGPLENGRTLASADLDAWHGHEHATAEYPTGIYHYHVTADAPYINGSGYRGVPGTVGR